MINGVGACPHKYVEGGVDGRVSGREKRRRRVGNYCAKRISGENECETMRKVVWRWGLSPWVGGTVEGRDEETSGDGCWPECDAENQLWQSCVTLR